MSTEDEWEKLELEALKINEIAEKSAVVIPTRLLNNSITMSKEINFFQEQESVSSSSAPIVEMSVDPSLQDALQNSRERMSLLNIENMILTFVKSNDRTFELPASQYNAFRRLLVYRVAQRFRLEHSTNETNERGLVISLYKTSEICYPSPLLIDFRFDNVSSESGSTLNEATYPQLNDQQPSASQQPNSNKKVLVMKRNSSKSGEMSNKDSLGNKNKPSAAEKEKAYAAARARIFGEETSNEEWALTYDEAKSNDSAEVNTDTNKSISIPQPSISKNKSKSSMDGSDNNQQQTGVIKSTSSSSIQASATNDSSRTNSTPPKKLNETNQQNIVTSKASSINIRAVKSASPLLEKSSSHRNSLDDLNEEIGRGAAGLNAEGSASNKSNNGSRSSKKNVDSSLRKDSSKFTMRDKDAERSDPDFARRSSMNNNNNNSNNNNNTSSYVTPPMNTSSTEANNSPQLNNYSNVPVYPSMPYGQYPPNMYQSLQPVPPNNMQQQQWIPQPPPQGMAVQMNLGYFHPNPPLPMQIPMSMQMYPTQQPDYYHNQGGGGNYYNDPNLNTQQYHQNLPNRNYPQSNSVQPNNYNNSSNQGRVANKNEFPPLGKS